MEKKKVNYDKQGAYVKYYKAYAQMIKSQKEKLDSKAPKKKALHR